MGEDAKVFIFDHDTYMRELAPAFYELLLSGRIPAWLHPALARRQLSAENWPRVDLLRYCTYLAEDFSWEGPYDDISFYEAHWREQPCHSGRQRACRSVECLERTRCPFHHDDSSGAAEDIIRIFEAAVSIKCLGQGQFVGRSLTPIHYREVLPGLGVTQYDPLPPLLASLGKRGFVIGYQWGFGYEGINGWLDPRETVELFQRLDTLPLPRYEVSFEAMGKFQRPHSMPGLHERFGLTTYECPGFSFEELSLSFVRTVAELATRQNKGLLWGNGVMPADFYLQPLG